jgi:hypothetical protein
MAELAARTVHDSSAVGISKRSKPPPPGGFRIFASLDLALSNPLKSSPRACHGAIPGKLLHYRQPQGSGANHRRG